MPDIGKEDVRSQIWLWGWKVRGGQPGTGLGGKELHPTCLTHIWQDITDQIKAGGASF